MGAGKAKKEGRKNGRREEKDGKKETALLEAKYSCCGQIAW